MDRRFIIAAVMVGLLLKGSADASSLGVKWRFKAKTKDWFTLLSVTEDRVFLATKERLYALDRNGKLLWQREIETSRIEADEGYIYCDTAKGLEILSRENGRLYKRIKEKCLVGVAKSMVLCQFLPPPEPPREKEDEWNRWAMTLPLIYNKQEMLYAYTKEGNPLWKKRVGGRCFSLLTEEKNIIVSYERHLLSISHSGEVLWKKEFKEGANFSCADGKVFVKEKEKIMMIDKERGEAIWKYIAPSQITSNIITFGKIVCLGTEDGWVYGIDTHKGKVRWRYPVDEREMRWVKLIKDRETLYIRSDRVLYLINPSSGKNIARYGIGRRDLEVSKEEIIYYNTASVLCLSSKPPHLVDFVYVFCLSAKPPQAYPFVREEFERLIESFCYRRQAWIVAPKFASYIHREEESFPLDVSLQNVIADYREIISRDPSNPFYYFYLGWAYKEQGKDKETEKNFQEAYQLADTSMTHLILGIGYDRLDMYTWADRHYERAAELYQRDGKKPSDFQSFFGSPMMLLYRQVVERHYGEGKIERALTALKQQMKFCPDIEGAYMNWLVMEEIYCKKGEKEKAKRAHREAIEKFIDDPRAFSAFIADQILSLIAIFLVLLLLLAFSFFIAYQKFRRHNLEERGAIGFKGRFRYALTKPLTYLKHSSIFYYKKREKGLLIALFLGCYILMKFVVLQVSYIGDWLILPSAYRSGDYGYHTVIDDLEEKVKKDPNNPDLHYILGYAYQKAKDLQKAEKEYRLLLKLNPSEPAAWNNLGAIQYEKNALDEAKENYQKALALNPNLASAHYNLSLIYQSQGLLKEALREEDEAARIDVELINIHKKWHKDEPVLEAFDRKREKRAFRPSLFPLFKKGVSETLSDFLSIFFNTPTTIISITPTRVTIPPITLDIISFLIQAYICLLLIALFWRPKIDYAQSCANCKNVICGVCRVEIEGKNYCNNCGKVWQETHQLPVISSSKIKRALSLCLSLLIPGLYQFRSNAPIRGFLIALAFWYHILLLKIVNLTGGCGILTEMLVLPNFPIIETFPGEPLAGPFLTITTTLACIAYLCNIADIAWGIIKVRRKL